MTFARVSPRLSALRLTTFNADRYKPRSLARGLILGAPGGLRQGAVVAVAAMDPKAAFNNSRGYTSSCLNSKGEPVRT